MRMMFEKGQMVMTKAAHEAAESARVDASRRPCTPPPHYLIEAAAEGQGGEERDSERSRGGRRIFVCTASGPF